MLALLDTSEDLAVCAEELGVPCEQLLTPLTRFKLRSEHFAIDNGAFARFERAPFEALLEREREKQYRCRWVTAPDVVGSARRTLECWPYWWAKLRDKGWKVALVAQDGVEDLPIPWSELTAIFIGGTTAWKLSKSAADVIRAARILEKWVHVGRVNTPGRFEYFEELGADSIDGTGLAKYSWMRKAIWDRHHAPMLWDVQEVAVDAHG